MRKKFNNSWSDEEKISYIKEINKGYTHPGSGRNLGLESASGLEFLRSLEFLSDKELVNGFIEIGSAWGASFHFWSSLIEGIKISVDIPYDMNIKGGGIDPWPPGLTSNVFESRLKKWESHFDEVYSVVGYSYNEKTIDSVRKILGDKKVSYLFIDAEHTYDAVKKDYECYKEFVEPGGFIGFHDIQIGKPKNMSVFWSEIKSDFSPSAFVMQGTNEKIGLIKV